MARAVKEEKMSLETEKMQQEPEEMQQKPEEMQQKPEEMQQEPEEEKINREPGRKYRIKSPTAFSGEIGGVQFLAGTAFTDDDFKASWFRNKGYLVEQ